MPAKKAKRMIEKKGVKARVTKVPAEQLSYDSKVIITVLLLLFVYPIGLAFMWGWMRHWSSWLKWLITLPFAAFLLSLIVVSILLGTVLKDYASYTQSDMQYKEKMWKNYQDNESKPFQIQ